eukprot:TRINITY_DN28911_c0_g1_i1.p1 TRINITY_DN28911_c0_g1~~TRINITY_DN28911_c0_g1_i1.p1  ORF type:complete len:283 (+),score=59.95 TRINITY_DN28911_c0_g1_i1:61-909(+)
MASGSWWQVDDISFCSESNSDSSTSINENKLRRCGMAVNPQRVRNWYNFKTFVDLADATVAASLVVSVMSQLDDDYEPEPQKCDYRTNDYERAHQRVPELTKDIHTPFEQWVKDVETKARENVAKGLFRKPLYCTNGWKQLRMKTSGNLPPPPVRLDLLSSPAINFERSDNKESKSNELLLQIPNRNIEWRSSPSPLKAAAEFASLLLSSHQNFELTPTPPSAMSSVPFKCRKRPSSAPASRGLRNYVPPSAVCLDCKQPIFMSAVCDLNYCYLCWAGLLVV